MARVYPQDLTSPPYMSAQKEVFTLWMRSLVYQTSGLTVYDSRGEIAYRVEHYGRMHRCSDEVHVMDPRGDLLLIIRQKRPRFCRSWYVYRCGSCSSSMKRDRPLVRVRRVCGSFMRSSEFEVKAGNEAPWIMKLDVDSQVAFQILDRGGDIIAEVKQKQTIGGIKLGEDVLALEAKPCVDHSILAALVTIYGLISRKI